MGEKQGQKVLLIGWDAADWKFINPLLDAGLMPHLSRLVDGGVIANLATLQPCLSPILWTSIATGKTADKHGITGFVEPVPGGGGVRLSSSTSRTTKALWNILSQNGLRSVVVNWFASHPAEPILGTCISNRFFSALPADPELPWEVVPGSVHPATLAPLVSGLRMHPAEFSLQDLTRMIPAISQIDRTDRRPLELAELLARTVSVHSVATGAMQAEEWDFMAVYYDGLDVGGHLFMPFHPPRMPNVPEDDFRLYQHVMRELYLFHDEMLGRLLELAGDGASVMLVSDHGFHSDQLRPVMDPAGESEEALAAAWHRQYGVFALRGPGVIRDERIYGASLLDIAPTVLTLFGLPVGQDMDGRPLIQAFENPPAEIQTVPAWDSVRGQDGMHPAELQQSMMESPEAVEQLIALGYLPAATAESELAAGIAKAESEFNLAIVHSSHGRSRTALEILERLHAGSPGVPRYAIALAKTLANLQQHSRCLEVLRKLAAGGPQPAEVDLLLAATLFNLGRQDEALLQLAETERKHPPGPGLYSLIGRIRLNQKDWLAASAAFGKSLEFNEDDPHSHNGLALAFLNTGDFESAADHALRAVGLLFFFPQAHCHLGLAMKGMGDLNRAIRSLNLAVTQAPGYLEAHQELANLYEQTNNVPLWLNHQRIASGLPPLQ